MPSSSSLWLPLLVVCICCAVLLWTEWKLRKEKRRTNRVIELAFQKMLHNELHRHHQKNRDRLVFRILANSTITEGVIDMYQLDALQHAIFSVVGLDRKGNTEPFPQGTSVSWSSSDTSILDIVPSADPSTVDIVPSGKNFGDATVSVSVTLPNTPSPVTDTFVVTVVPAQVVSVKIQAGTPQNQ